MTTTYLSPTIQNELVLLLNKKVKNIIFEDVREPKYFAIMCDSTTDTSHDSHSQICNNQKQYCPREGIVFEFLFVERKTAAEFSQSILEELELNNLDVMMCRE